MPGTVYRFSRFSVDTSAHTLSRDGLRISIQEQPFQVLLALLASPGQVVTREALRTRLWGTDTFVDFDQSLNSAVRRLRLALEDNSRTPIYIETIPRVGFRFLPEVEAGTAHLRQTHEDRSATEPDAPSPTALPQVMPVANDRRLSLKALATGVLTLLLGLALGIAPSWWAAHGGSTAHTTAERQQAAEDAAFVQGPRSLTPAVFSRESGTSTATTDSLSELQGWYHLRQRTQADYIAARQDFERALALQPKSPSALVGLAQTDILMALNGDTPPERLQQARAAGQKALAMSPHLAAAHTVIGAADALTDWNDAEAEQEFQTALHIDPQDSLSHLWFAVFVLLPQQKYGEAEREASEAVRQDPLSLIAHTDLGWILYSEGKRTAALEQYRFVLQLNPGFVPAQFRLHQIAADQGGAQLRPVLEASGSDSQNIPAVEPASFHATKSSSVCAGIGQPHPTMNEVRDAVEEHCPVAYFFGQNPELARLRTDPSFIALMKSTHSAQSFR